MPATLGYALANFGLRYVRWERYLATMGIALDRASSVRIFLVSLVLSVTPGKAGKVLKAVQVKRQVGTPVGATASVVFTERLTDLFALIVLSLVGISSIEAGTWTLTLAIVGSVGLLAIVFVAGLLPSAISLAARIPGLCRLAGPAMVVYAGARGFLSSIWFCEGFSLGTLTWFAECLGFYFILSGFRLTVEVVSATFIYGFATIFGALTLLPGGLGTSEGSMAGCSFSAAAKGPLLRLCVSCLHPVVRGRPWGLHAPEIEPRSS